MHQNGAPIWHLHTKLYKGQIVYTLVFYSLSFSWFLPLDGFQFNSLLRDGENDQYFMKRFSFQKHFVTVRLFIVELRENLKYFRNVDRVVTRFTAKDTQKGKKTTNELFSCLIALSLGVSRHSNVWRTLACCGHSNVQRCGRKLRRKKAGAGKRGGFFSPSPSLSQIIFAWFALLSERLAQATLSLKTD